MAGRMGRGNPLRMPGPSADMMMGMRGSVLGLALLLLNITALYSLWAEFKLSVVPWGRDGVMYARESYPGVYWGIRGYTPYTNLWCFLTAYTCLICHNNRADTVIYRCLVYSVYTNLVLAIHHWSMVIPPSYHYTTGQWSYPPLITTPLVNGHTPLLSPVKSGCGISVCILKVLWHDCEHGDAVSDPRGPKLDERWSWGSVVKCG